MSRVKYPSQQPDSTMDGTELDSFLTSMATATGSVDGTNLRDRGLDHRSVASGAVAEMLNFAGSSPAAPIRLGTRAAQGMTAGSYAALNPGVPFTTGNFTLETNDIVELEASIYVSAAVAGTEEGLLAGDQLNVKLQYSNNSGGAWSDLAGSERRMGHAAATINNALGNTEPVAHHGSVAPFAVYEATTGTAVSFRVVVFSNNSNDVYFEASSFAGVRLRRAN